MTALSWDEIGARQFEGGVDRGVIYLDNGVAIPWSGLTSVSEQPKKTAESIYYDGAKVRDVWTLGDYAATIRAITYPDELLDLEGLEMINVGVFVADQEPKPFSMSYRTGIGNDLDGEAKHHKIHILFDLVANPSDKSYQSLSADPALTEFEWEVTSVPPEVPGFRPTAHIVVDTSKIPYWMVESLMTILYGDEFTDPGFLTPEEFIEFLLSVALWMITDNGDGTFTAETTDDELMTDLGGGEVQLDNVTIEEVNETTYILTTSYE